jgi:putative tricarboxylic transport membrane protein
MVPTLALGIPGSGTTAIILVALMMHGFRPGPYLIRETPEFVYAIFGAMLMANVMFFFLGMVGAKVFARVTLIPRTFLWPVVLVFSVVGSYALNQSPFDVYVMLISGVLGYVMLRHGFGPAPFVMGLILGRLVEDNWSNAMVFYDHEMIRFLESPIVVAFLLMSLITLFWIPLTNAAKKIRATNVESVSDD